ncbi:MAG: RNA polymerase sigma factor [Elusimicrobia bacterium]|nr:RNA polymerase sigma factor [Elusimicrobiota bacterium]MDE2510969.1 RNA polymerase sigma factor [Elusimicrobiota bacterium]
MLSSDDLERFVEEYGDHAYGFAFSLCGNEPDARELVQDAFVKIFDRAARFDDAQSLESWYMTVLKNLFLDGRRRWERKNGVSLDAPVGEESSLNVADCVADDRDVAMLERLERRESAAQVRRALGRLSPDARAILTLVDIEGRGYEEAAEALGCPLGTVRSRISRARDALRERLLGMEG